MTREQSGNKTKHIPIRHITGPSKESDSAENFNIRKIGELLQNQPMIQESHRHDFFYMLALKMGSGHHNIDFVPYTIKDYLIFFMRPGQVHSLVLETNSKGYLIQFSNDFYAPQDHQAKQYLRSASNINYYPLNAESYQNITNLLDYIHQEYDTKQQNYEAVIKANMSILFIELIRQKNLCSSAKQNHYAQERLEEFLALLETHIFSHKKVSQYAELLNLSVYQLNTITKTMLDKTASELIIEQIILEAKRHLLATGNQINQIAHHMNYEDVSYFIRFFKKHTGHSPEAFRHNFR